MPMTAPSSANPTHKAMMKDRRMVVAATLSTKFGFLVRALKMERARG